MALLTQVKLPSGTVYDLSDANALINMGTLGTGGTITALPTAAAANKNYVYRVITAGTYASKAAKVDDLFWSDGSAWHLLVANESDTTYTFAEGSVDGAFSVTPSGGSAQSVPIHGLNNSAYKDYDTTVTQSSSNLITSGAVWTAIDNLPEPMVFRGTVGAAGDSPTITALPVDGSAQVGDTYKVITAGTYASTAAKVGDVFVCLTKTGSANTWTLIPAGDTDTDTWRNIKVNGTEKLGSAISTGGVDFVNGTNTTVEFDATGNKIKVNADLSSAVTNVSYDTTNKKFQQTKNGSTTDIATLATTSVPNVTDVGSTPTLGTAIAADDITAWSTNTPTVVDFTVEGTQLQISVTDGVAASLSYTEKSIPNVTNVGSTPTLGAAISVATGFTTA